ncbi:UNVERIFIED_CONTAM: hypothetical protein GTU68_015969 [Idotea baltica]|nr:hypothetical protein [Idotea baltica]
MALCVATWPKRIRLLSKLMIIPMR